jgi:hypothetical protein
VAKNESEYAGSFAVNNTPKVLNISVEKCPVI